MIIIPHNLAGFNKLCNVSDDPAACRTICFSGFMERTAEIEAELTASREKRKKEEAR